MDEELVEKLKSIGKLVIMIAAIIYFWKTGLIENIYNSITRMTGG